jgi:hypothetical protein
MKIITNKENYHAMTFVIALFTILTFIGLTIYQY